MKWINVTGNLGQCYQNLRHITALIISIKLES